MLRELDEVLSRPKFDRYLSREARERFFQAFVVNTTLVHVTEQFTVCRDPEDNAVLELAVSGGATYIITGDEDLLVLDPFRGISIITTDRFLLDFAPSPE
ncbi:MAG: putative toxin-antitoxin system toxin component, PIN family [Chloroflexota bacterium]|nr:putative toxin-antitoxin system toxin component, PIN family [Chloroflexota bacterium]